MKKLILAIVAIALSLNLYSAKLINLSDEAISAIKNDLVSQEIRRKRVITATKLGSGLAMGYMLYKMWGETNPADASPFYEAYNRLTPAQRDAFINLRVMPQVVAQQNRPDDRNIFQRGASWVKNTFTSTFSSNNIKFFLTGYLFNQCMGIVSRFLPSVDRFAEYIFRARTISWYVLSKTSLMEAGKSLTGSFVMRSRKPDNKDLISSANMFIQQIQSTLGYMAYRTEMVEKIDPIAHEKGLAIIKNIKEQVVEITKAIEGGTLESEVGDADPNEAFIGFILAVTQECENFKQVEKKIVSEDYTPVDLNKKMVNLILSADKEEEEAAAGLLQ